MKKKIVFTYTWVNEAEPNKAIPVHHETKLMGYSEFFVPKERRGRNTYGKMEYTFTESGKTTVYKGMWEVRYED